MTEFAFKVRRDDLNHGVDILRLHLEHRENTGAFIAMKDYGAQTITPMLTSLLDTFDYIAGGATWSPGEGLIPDEMQHEMGPKTFNAFGWGTYNGSHVEMWCLVNGAARRPHVYWGISGDLAESTIDALTKLGVRAMENQHAIVAAARY